MSDSKELVTVENCAFALKCPRHWNDLDTTEQQNVRYCLSCERAVYLCVSQTEFISHAKLGHCVALQTRTDKREPVYFVGQPSGGSSYNADQ